MFNKRKQLRCRLYDKVIVYYVSLFVVIYLLAVVGYTNNGGVKTYIIIQKSLHFLHRLDFRHAKPI